MKTLSKNSRGFTLIELLVAIAILTIVSLVGLASFNSAGKSNEVLQQAEEMKSLARKLKTDATAATKPLACPTTTDPNTTSVLYGTYINFKRGDTAYRYGISCWSPLSISNTNALDYSPTASVKQLPSGVTLATTSSSSSSFANTTVFYSFDGEVYWFNCDTHCSGGNNSGIAPTRASIINPPNTLVFAIQTGAEAFFTNGQSHSRVAFGKAGLVCEEKVISLSPINPPTPFCSRPN